jgi:hypothetical protein
MRKRVRKEEDGERTELEERKHQQHCREMAYPYREKKNIFNTTDEKLKKSQ